MPPERLPRPIAPITAPIPSVTHAPPSASDARDNAAESSEMANLRASSFWVQKGMSTLFDWMTDPHNWSRMQKKNPVAGQKQNDLLKEICQLVNNKHGTNWTVSQAKSKLAYIKKKYREAAALDSAGEGASVRQKRDELCPIFSRLHTVLGSSLSAYSLPPRQTRCGRVEVDLSDEASEESSDLDVHDDVSDYTIHTDIASTGYRGSISHINKRRRMDKGPSKDILELAAQVSEQSNRQYQAYDIYRNDLRTREEVLVQREMDWTERMLRHAADARMQIANELAAEKAEFKQELAAARQRLQAEIQEFHKEKAAERQQLKAEIQEFHKERAAEREQLKAERQQFQKETASFWTELYKLRAEARACSALHDRARN